MAESRNKKYSSERNQLVAMPPIATTVLGTKLGTTLLIGLNQQRHCDDGLLPLLVALPLIMAESRAVPHRCWPATAGGPLLTDSQGPQRASGAVLLTRTTRYCNLVEIAGILTYEMSL